MVTRNSDVRRLLKEARAIGTLVNAEFRRIVRRAENQRRVIIGPHSYVFGGANVMAYRGDDASAQVLIGSYSSIAEGTQFLLGGGHRVDWVSTFPFRIALGLPGAYVDGHPASNGNIVIGSDVWVGKDAKILGGVTIGHGAVIGAGAVVARDVAPYDIVVGNPARVLRSRVTPQQRTALLRLCWWDWPDGTVRDFADILSSTRIDEFISAAQDRMGGSATPHAIGLGSIEPD